MKFLSSLLSLISIGCYFLLSLFTPTFFGTTIPTALPLYLIVLVVGFPLIFKTFLKLLKLDFGSDLLGILSIITSLFLNQPLAAVLIILMLTGGEALESYAMRKASSVLSELASRMPSEATRRDGASLKKILVSEIKIGDDIVVAPHETIPVDGIVLSGHGVVDESYLTGEPYQVLKTPGGTVLSGSINSDTLLTIRAEKLAIDSRYAQIMTVMNEAVQQRPNTRRLGDRIGAFFAPIVLIIALLTWYFTESAMRFLTILVVATPCPLLIAIPITFISAISLAARLGIIIRDPRVLELLPTCRTAIFDKTGTLTYGKPELTDIILNDHWHEEDILFYAASLEQYSKHPLAAAVLERAVQRHVVLSEVDQVSERPGQGLIGTVNAHKVCITDRHHIQSTFPEFFSLLPPISRGLECIILIDDRYAATLTFRDTPRSDSYSFVSHLSLKHSFKKIFLLSGDRKSEVDYLADLLGIKDRLSGQSPEQKVALVRQESALAPTLFMGDGINDAPALALASVGIAFGQHNAITSQAAGAVIMDTKLIKVEELLHLSIKMRRIVLQSAIGGMLLSFIAIGFAAFGKITPVQGALIQELIDVVAILNSLRLLWGNGIDTDLPTLHYSETT